MIKYSLDELCLIWLDSFIGLEYKHKLELYKLINGKAKISEVLQKGKDYIVNNIGLNDYELLKNSANDVYLKYILKELERREIVAITIKSANYPKLLKETTLPPLVLYTKGDVGLLDSQIFGIVGSRRSLPLSIKATEEYTKAMIDNGFTVVTGTAEGVDSAVIKTALNKGGKVISVVAGGFDNIYPASNAKLIESIAKDGLIISEQLPEIASKPYFFPVRNRIIAGLSKGVLIVSAGEKSGAIYTAEYAEEYSRDVFAIPYNIGVPSGAGCNKLIKQFASLTDSPQDILEFYGIEQVKEEIQLSDIEKTVINSLKDGSMHLENIAKQTGKPVYEIMPILSAMEIKGLVIKTGINIYGLSRSSLIDKCN